MKSMPSLLLAALLTGCASAPKSANPMGLTDTQVAHCAANGGCAVVTHKALHDALEQAIMHGAAACLRGS